MLLCVLISVLLLEILKLFRLLLIVLQDTATAFEYNVELVAVVALVHHEFTLFLAFNPAVAHNFLVKAVWKVTMPLFFVLLCEMPESFQCFEIRYTGLELVLRSLSGGLPEDITHFFNLRVVNYFERIYGALQHLAHI